MTVEQVEEDITLLLLELSTTNSALASMVNPLQDDLATAYDLFSESSKSLEDASERFIAMSRKMEVEGKEFASEWEIEDDTYENPEIQKLSEKRRSDLGLVYAKIADSRVGIQGDLKQYVSNVQEVEIYFSTDLTTGGVAAITSFVNRTFLDGSNLSMKLREMLESVKIVRFELSGETAAAIE